MRQRFECDKPSYREIDIKYLECVDGRFGDNCTGTCGHCSDLHDCQKSDGICLTGCTLGYDYHKDNGCKEGKLNLEQTL